MGELFIYQLPSNVSINTTVEFDVKYNKKTGKPYAVFLKIAERNITRFNTEDRNRWYEFGEGEEEVFVQEISPRLGIELVINPAKEHDPTVIDLWDLTNQKYADLKRQTTPFFTSSRYVYKGRRYSPRFTVTFNKKDYEKYIEEYPDCDIYFWVNWDQLRYRDTEIEPLNGVWRAPFFRMREAIENNIVTLHSYKHRADDNHNAQESFLFNLNDPDIFTRLL